MQNLRRVLCGVTDNTHSQVCYYNALKEWNTFLGDKDSNEYYGRRKYMI